MIDKLDAPEHVIEIHPDCKYVIKTDPAVSREKAANLASTIEKWYASNSPFLVLSGKVKLVRVDDDDARVDAP